MTQEKERSIIILIVYIDIILLYCKLGCLFTNGNSFIILYDLWEIQPLLTVITSSFFLRFIHANNVDSQSFTCHKSFLNNLTYLNIFIVFNAVAYLRFDFIVHSFHHILFLKCGFQQFFSLINNKTVLITKVLLPS